MKSGAYSISLRVKDLHLKAKGISIDPKADETTSCPAGIMVKDPDRMWCFLTSIGCFWFKGSMA